MIVSYTTGVDVLAHHLEDISRGQFRVLLVFLGSTYDEAFLKSVKSLATDLDNLTGPHCLAIVFMPPPKENPFRPYDFVWSEGKFRGGGKYRHVTEWESFVDEMTRNTYELASFLGIPLHYLPCLAFIDPQYPEEFATLRLHDETLYDIYPQLRKLFSQWYAENKDVLDAYDLATREYPYTGGYGDIPNSPRIKRLTEERLRQGVIPAVEEAFGSLLAANRDLDQEKVRRRLKKLRKQPQNTQPLVSFLQTHALTIQLDGIPTTWSNFDSVYRRLYQSKALPDPYQFGPQVLASNVSRFPMHKVKSMGNNAELRRLGRRVGEGTVASKPAFDIVLAILKVFGLGAGASPT
jgi:hypothetical protein